MNLSHELWYLLIPVIAVTVAALLVKFYNRPRPPLNTPGGMLDELCRAHGISRRQRGLLDRIAEATEMTQPAALLLSVENFDRSVADAGEKIRLDRRTLSGIAQLRSRLFAAPDSD